MGELEDALCGSSGKWVPHKNNLPQNALFLNQRVEVNKMLTYIHCITNKQ